MPALALQASSDDIMLTGYRLTVDDARTAQDAGARFARDMTGAHPADFMVALAEQEDLTRRAITDAGFSTGQARMTAEHFEVAARDEWERLAQQAVEAPWPTDP